MQDGSGGSGRYGTAGGESYSPAAPRRLRRVGAHRAVEESAEGADNRFGQRGLITESRVTPIRGHDIPEPRDAGEDADPDPEQPLADGQTLRELLNERNLTPAETTRLGAQLADALARRHSQGHAHGQLTPITVRVTPAGRARLLDPPELAADALDPAAVPYLSPEQVTGEPGGPPADVYALGLVLLEAATGYPAYPGSGWEAAASRLTAPPVVPNEVPGALAGTLLAMTQTAPGDRPTAERAAARLGGGWSVTPAAPVASVRVEHAGMSQLIALGLPVLVLLALLGVALLSHHGTLSDSATGTSASVAPEPTAAPAAAAPAATTPATAPAATNAPAETTAPTAAQSNTAQPKAAQPNTAQPTAGPASGLALPNLPDIKAPDIAPDIKAPDLPSSITDTITTKVKSTWHQFTGWLATLF
ncbi:MAG: eukaryotic-like serine/threonine-protein kinase [Pseudonocardiales bacterium]|nr:eukaryotic-like serine/threonine-protein kinase [Pseudonocardiales bacterium]